MLISKFLFVGLIFGVALGMLGVVSFWKQWEDMIERVKVVVACVVFGLFCGVVAYSVYMLALTTGWFG